MDKTPTRQQLERELAALEQEIARIRRHPALTYRQKYDGLSAALHRRFAVISALAGRPPDEEGT